MQSLYVRSIVTGPSGILDDDEIRGVTRTYEGKTVGISELYRIVDDLNALYVQKGHPLSRAALPAQTVENGVVQIRLVEVRVGQVVVQGNRNTRETYVLRRMSLGPGDYFRLDRLDHDLGRFNAVNDVQLRAELRQGAEFGTTDYVLTVLEPKHSELRMFVGNGGRTETGALQGGVTWSDRSLFGWRDRVTIAYVKSLGSTSASAAYNVPIHPSGARVEIGYAKSDTRIVAGPAEELDVTGAASDTSVKLSMPVSVSDSGRVDASVALHSKASDTYLSGVRLLASRVNSVSLSYESQLGVDHRQRVVRHVLTAGSQEGALPFLMYRGDYSLQRPWGDWRTVRYLASVQLASADTLPVAERFSVSGTEGASGYSLRAELHWHTSPELTPFLFFDHEGALGSDAAHGAGAEMNSINAGVGANLRWSERFTGRLSYAVRLGGAHEATEAVTPQVQVRFEIGL